MLFISSDRITIQYNSDTVAIGRHYPMTTMDKFLRWAKSEVQQ